MRDSQEGVRKLNALLRLGILRQAPQELETLKAYIEELEPMPSDVVEICCQKIARRPKGEYEPAFPAIGTILQECRSHQARVMQEIETSRLLNPPAVSVPSELQRQRKEKFLAELRDIVNRKRM